MKAEIIAVGTELLLGQIVNSNAAFLSEELAGLGFEVYYHTVVGDNPERLQEVLDIAVNRSALVVLCGGLGPTEDDLTKDVVADFLGQQLVMDQPAMDKILEHVAGTGRVMTENNRRQALYIEGSQVLANPTGLAVGCLAAGKGCHFMLFPGPPSELQPMFQQSARPLLKALLPETELLYSRVLRFFGIGESQLVTILADLIHQQTNPTIAPYAKSAEVTLRLTAKAKNQATAEDMLDQIEKAIQALVGDYFYGYGDENSLQNVVVELLKAQGKTVTAAESLTCGMFQDLLGGIAGVSEVFPGGFVTYSPQVKAQLLIPQAELDAFGVVSENCAKALAEGARAKLDTDFGLSFTGVAGPESLEGQAVGTVWIGLAQRGSEPVATLHHFKRDRQAIRYSSVMTGLGMLRERLLK